MVLLLQMKLPIYYSACVTPGNNSEPAYSDT